MKNTQGVVTVLITFGTIAESTNCIDQLNIKAKRHEILWNLLLKNFAAVYVLQQSSYSIPHAICPNPKTSRKFALEVRKIDCKFSPVNFALRGNTSQYTWFYDLLN